MGKKTITVSLSPGIRAHESYKQIVALIEEDERLSFAKNGETGIIAIPSTRAELEKLEGTDSHIFFLDTEDGGGDTKTEVPTFKVPGELIAEIDDFANAYLSNRQQKNVRVVGFSEDALPTGERYDLHRADTVQEAISHEGMDLLVMQQTSEGDDASVKSLTPLLEVQNLPPVLIITDPEELSDRVNKFFQEDQRRKVLVDDTTPEARVAAALLRGRGYEVVTEETDEGSLFVDLTGLEEEGLSVFIEQLTNQSDTIIASTMQLLQIAGTADLGFIHDVMTARAKHQKVEDFLRFRGDYTRMASELPAEEVPSLHDMRTALEDDFLRAYIHLKTGSALDYEVILDEIKNVDFIKRLPVEAFYDTRAFKDELSRRFGTIDNLTTEPAALAQIKRQVAEGRRQKIIEYLESEKLAYLPLVRTRKVEGISKHLAVNVQVRLPGVDYTTTLKLFNLSGLNDQEKEKIKEAIEKERQATRWYAKVGFEGASGTSFLYGKDFAAIIMRCVQEKGLPEVLEEAGEEERDTLMMRVMDLGAKRAAYAPEQLAEKKDVRAYWCNHLLNDPKASLTNTFDLLLKANPRKRKWKRHNDALKQGENKFLKEIYSPVLDIIEEQPGAFFTDAFLYNWRSNDREELSIRGVDYGSIRVGLPLVDDIACALRLKQFVKDHQTEKRYVQHYVEKYGEYIIQFNQFVGERKARNDDFKHIINIELEQASENTANRDIKAELDPVIEGLTNTTNKNYKNTLMKARDDLERQKRLGERTARKFYETIDDALVYEDNLRKKSYTPQEEVDYMTGYFASKIHRSIQLANIFAYTYNNIESSEDHLRNLKSVSQAAFDGIVQLKKYLKSDYFPAKKTKKTTSDAFERKLRKLQSFWRDINEGIQNLQYDPKKSEDQYWNNWKALSSN